MGDSPASGPDRFVGRLDELADLRSALRAAADGSGAVRLIAGEPGIGKTRLAREVAGGAERDGFAIGWGRTWEAGGAPPFWPWVRALRELLRCHDADVLEALMGGASAVATLLPELSRVADPPAHATATGWGTADERFAVFEAVSTLLRELSRRRPVLLVLEDVHAADEASLLLLQFVAADVHAARVLVLATFRDVEALQDEARAARLSEIARQGSVLQLAGLTTAQTRSLLATRLAQPAPDDFVAEVQDATSGNPFFVEEVVRLHRAGADGPRVPPGVRATVRSRLRLLPSQTHEVLVTAAVYGRSFDEQVLARILDRPVEEMDDLLSPALDATLVVRDGDELRFRHGLFREVLVDEAPAAERGRIHARVVDVLENLPALARERHLSELAHHAVRAVSGGAERAVAHARNAGDAAMRALAFEEAARRYEEALDVAALTSTSELLTLDLLVALARAHASAGELVRAREVARQAGELAERAGSGSHLAQAALAYPSMAMAVWRVDEEHLAMLQQALSALGEDGDAATRSALLCTLVTESYFGRTPVQDLMAQAVRLAEESGDPLALAQAEFASQYAFRDGRMTAAALERNRTVPLAHQAGDVALEATARRSFLGRWLELGALTRVEAELVDYERLVERTRRPVDVWWGMVMRGMLLLHEGRYREAEHAVRETVDYGYRFAGAQALSVFGAQDFLVRLDRVPWEEVLAGLLALPDDFRQRLPVRSSLVRVHAALQQRERVHRELAEFAADDYALLPLDRSRLACLGLLADAAADVGDRVRAEELLRLMAPYEGALVAAPPFAVFGPFDLYRGRLLHVLGRHDQAAKALHAAVSTCDGTNARPYAARARFHLASLLRDTGDHRSARALLVQARDEARALGLPLLEGAAGARLDELGGDRSAPDGSGVVRLRREGEYWTVSSDSGALRLRDSKGLHYLSRLLSRPGEEVHVLELAGAAPGPGRPSSDGPTSTASDDVGPVLDEQAKRAYRRRISELQEEIDEAVELQDHERAARAREEHDVFVAELSRALGLHGRDRRAGSVAEQARINVGKAVRTAVRRVQEQDPVLGAELDAAVRTGLFCTYLPLAGHRRWEVAAHG